MAKYDFSKLNTEHGDSGWEASEELVTVPIEGGGQVLVWKDGSLTVEDVPPNRLAVAAFMARAVLERCEVKDEPPKLSKIERAVQYGNGQSHALLFKRCEQSIDVYHEDLCNPICVLKPTADGYVAHELNPDCMLKQEYLDAISGTLAILNDDEDE